MGYIDPHQSPGDPDEVGSKRHKRRLREDAAQADSFDRQVLFERQSTYRGSPAALKRMAARAGKSEWTEHPED